MATLKQFRGKRASLWQSAVDEVVAKEHAGSSPAAGFGQGTPHVKRPDQGDASILGGNDIAEALDRDQDVPKVPPPGPAAGIGDTVKFCSTTALKLAEARVKAFFTKDDTELKRLEEELGAPFGNCDPKWATVVAVYVASRLAEKPIPYRLYNDITDFVITDRLPDHGTVALVADWGTGQDGARKLLAKIAAKKPDTVIHLGDVYYSGTESEVQNYFYAIWQKVLGIPKVAWGAKLTDLAAKPATYHLTGNHDMYAGGQPYYTVIDMLGQPASYFCLRNEKWQFIALDTGLHDANPVAQGQPTFLEDTEVAWLKHKIGTAGSRKTILLSHHQLYTAYESEKIGGHLANEKLLAQVQDVLADVTAWFWGHEHNLVIFKEHLNVLGRCIGHGAFPVAVDDAPVPSPDVPIENVPLGKDSRGGLFQHGYVLLTLDGSAAKVTYFQYDPDTDKEVVQHTEDL